MAEWFRAYASMLDDPKVQKLPPALFKTWINVLCVASLHEGELPGLEDLAFRLRLDEEAAREQIDRLIAAGLIDRQGDVLTPHNWKGRQYQSDHSTERVRAFRARHRGEAKRDETVSETPPDSDSETETESSAAAGARARKPEIDLSQARPVGRDLLEAEARALMGEAAVVVDPDFTPILRLLETPGVERGDVLAGICAARDNATKRLVSWRQFEGWIVRAAQDRVGAAPPRARAPPARQSDLAVCLQIARSETADARPDARFDAAQQTARAGPLIEGRLVAL